MNKNYYKVLQEKDGKWMSYHFGGEPHPDALIPILKFLKENNKKAKKIQKESENED